MSDWSSGGNQALGYSTSETKMVRAPTLKDRLEMAVKEAEERLKAAKRAREIFDAHPELEELLNIMQNSHF